MDEVHECTDIVYRRLLQDAVAQVEDVPGPIARRLEHGLRLLVDHFARSE